MTSGSRSTAPRRGASQRSRRAIVRWGRVLARPNVGVAAVLLVALAGCSSDGSGTTSTVGVAPTTVVATAVPTTLAPATTQTSPPQPIGGQSAAAAPPHPPRVPGIDATDEFCAAWARYGGTVQIIAVAVNFGELDSVQSATLELESAPTIVGAVAEIGATWPAEVADERDVALDRYLGPYERRAEKAVEALRGAGVDDAGHAMLQSVWAQVLATRNPDEPTVEVELTDELAAKIDAGATAFDAAVT